jgi:O-methyltransferase
MLRQFARQCLRLEGDFAECGVYKGGTAHLLANTIRGSGKQLCLFDTFEGMPCSAEADASGHHKGDFGSTSIESVKKYLSPFDYVEFFPGFIPDTLPPLTQRKFSFVHVDVDLYSSVMDCCHFFYERLTPGGVLIFDDYGFKMYKQAGRRAVDEFFDTKPDQPIVLPTGQCLVIKSTQR